MTDPLSDPVLEAAIPLYRGPEQITVDARELLCLLDYLDSLARFCSGWMADQRRYYQGSLALWAVCHRLAGSDEMARRLIERLAVLNTNGIEAMRELEAKQDCHLRKTGALEEQNDD